MAVSRVLACHNFYLDAARSGEDSIYRDETTLLERAGVSVFRFERKNEELKAKSIFTKGQAAIAATYSRKTYRELTALIAATRPEVAHFHSIFPQVSVSALRACQDSKVPVVITLHNFRLNCANGLLLRNGTVCELCWGRNPLPGIAFRCYQGALLPALAAGAAQVLNRSRRVHPQWVDRYIALTEFSRGKHVDIGLPKERVVVKGNFLANPPSAGDGLGDYVIFVGRIGEEKGVLTLFEAWTQLGRDAPRLLMIGEGPLRTALTARAKREGLNIEVVGPKDRNEVLTLVREARLQIVASQCYEGFPLVMVEAMACGTPLLVSRIGGLPELVTEGATGALFTPGSATELIQALRGLLENPEHLERMRASSRALYEARFTPERNLNALLDVYNGAIATSRERHGRPAP